MIITTSSPPGSISEAPSPPASTEPQKRPAPAANKSGTLTDYQRETLVITTEFWGDEMLRLRGEAEAKAAKYGIPGPERIEWFGEQAAGWYEIARRLRVRQAVK